MSNPSEVLMDKVVLIEILLQDKKVLDLILSNKGAATKLYAISDNSDLIDSFNFFDWDFWVKCHRTNIPTLLLEWSTNITNILIRHIIHNRAKLLFFFCNTQSLYHWNFCIPQISGETVISGVNFNSFCSQEIQI